MFNLHSQSRKVAVSAMAVLMLATSSSHALSFKKSLKALAVVGAAAYAMKHVNASPTNPFEVSNVKEASSGFAACADQFPQGQPMPLTVVPSSLKPRALCFNQFAVLHSGVAKTSLVSVERLNAQRILAAKDEKRTDQFFADARVPSSERASLADYVGTGFDRGHMAPAADMPNAEAMAQSFSLANMVPQDPTNNREIWVKLEKDVRKFALRARGDIFVYSGPIYGVKPMQTIGKGKVWVPEKLFKVIYDGTTHKAYAFIVENSANTFIQPPVPYSEFKQSTGLDVLLGLPVL